MVPVGTRAPEPREIQATRTPSLSSMAVTDVPTQALDTSGWTRPTAPEGSTISRAIPPGSMRRIICSAVCRTVATVGIPSRS